MVTKSTINWSQHKQDVYNVLASKYGEDRAKKFIDFYAQRYDRFGRSFLNWKLAFYLFSDWNFIKSHGTKVYACVGDGGTGKTTLMKNVFYFLDDTITLERVNVDVGEFIKQVYALSPENIQEVIEPRSAFMDEPDQTLAPTSKEGKALRSILGKARQHKLALGICATDMADIPNYFWKKVSGIFFTPFLGKVWFLKNRPKKKSYPIQKIKSEYAIKGYQVFFEVQKFAGVLRTDTTAQTPFSKEQEAQYISNKYADYRNDLKKFIGMRSGEIDNKRDSAIINLHNQGMSQVKIAKIYNLTPERINQIVKSALTK
jgi:hypothetical protein